MLLATLVVLFQMPISAAAQVPAKPQASAPILMAENTPAKLPPPGMSEPLFPPPAPSDLFDRDRIRLVDIPAAADGTSPDKTTNAGTAQPSADLSDSASLLAEVHIPTEVEPPSAGYHPPHIAAERPAHTWLALSMVEHGAATFDAWTTRRAIEQGHVEMNPMLKPFAGNASIYAVIQVAPLLFDYVGRKMEYSDKSWMRRTWWLPQSLSAAASFFAGAHNLSVTK